MQPFRVNGKTSNYVECLIKHPREDHYLRTWVASEIVGYEHVFKETTRGSNIRMSDRIAPFNRVVQRNRVKCMAPSKFNTKIKVEENRGIRRDRVIDLDSAIGREVEKKISKKPRNAEEVAVRKQPDRLVKKKQLPEKAEGGERSISPKHSGPEPKRSRK